MFHVTATAVLVEAVQACLIEIRLFVPKFGVKRVSRKMPELLAIDLQVKLVPYSNEFVDRIYGSHNKRFFVCCKVYMYL